MNTIWKYEVCLEDEFTISMPKDAKILSVNTQNETSYLWAIVNTDNELENRKFKLFGTGQPDLNFDNLEFIGTIICYNDRLVFHLFEVK